MLRKVIGIICTVALLVIGAFYVYGTYELIGTTVPAHTITWTSTALSIACAVVIYLLATGTQFTPKPLPVILDRLRMAIWLAFGIAAYFASLAVGPANPIIQTTLYKVGHVTTLAWIGYWISRNAIGRLDLTSDQGDKLGRAIVMGAVIIAGSLGL